MERKIKALELQLRDTLGKFLILYEHSPDMYMSVDPEQALIKECNLTLLKKTGYVKEEVIGQPVFFLYHHDSIPAAKEAFQYFIEHGSVVNAELEIKTKKGKKIPVLLNVEAVRDEAGRIIYSNSCFRDITEVKNLQSQLQKANEDLEEKVKLRTAELERRNHELEQFAYVASHDLQEPLRTVTSFTELLAENYGHNFDELGQKCMQYITDATGRMGLLIKGLLDYSRIGRKREWIQVDCRQLLDQVLHDMTSSLNQNKASVNFGSLPKVYCCPTEMRVLFQNLISNAIKFHKPDVAPEVHISANKKNGSWQFSIKDNGIGIAPEHHERVFIIFQRLHNKSDYSGTGIGLAHCRKIVESLGGQIWFESELNKGTTFHFTYPN